MRAPGTAAAADRWVLVVDDNEAVRDTTVAILATAGFQAIAAEDADEAVRLLERGQISVLVLDLGVDRQGLRVLDSVTALPAVILLSFDREDPEDPRADAFFAKPIPPHLLIEAVARHTT